MRQVRCALVSVFGIQQSPLRYAAAAGLSELIRLSTDCTHSRAQALPGYPCSPSEFRQALPANGADGEAHLKVMGARGAGRGGGELSRALVVEIAGVPKIQKTFEIVAISNGSCWWNSE